jgi:monoterpene epsilon-lactone hydrolase
MLIQVGSHEILLSDSTRFADKARNAGVDVTLKIWDGMWHVFQFQVMSLPEALV